LALGEWKKVLKSIGKSPFWVTVSGGEPFIQPHLADFVIAIDRICQPAIINIPTNSLLPKRVRKDVIKILKKVKTPQLIINLSLDGVGKVHDSIRGISGNFEKVMENYRNLKDVQKQHPNLVIGFGSVISRYNIKQSKELFDYVFELEPNQYLTEIAEERAELDTLGLTITPDYKSYSKSINYLLGKMKKNRMKGIGRISRAFRFEYYHFVKDWLRGRKLLPDYAGFASCEITSWGDVWPSCIKGENIGNLRNVSYNFPKIWFSKEALRIRGNIKDKGTSYPLANAFYTSSLHDYPTLFRVIRRVLFQ